MYNSTAPAPCELMFSVHRAKQGVGLTSSRSNVIENTRHENNVVTISSHFLMSEQTNLMWSVCSNAGCRTPWALGLHALDHLQLFQATETNIYTKGTGNSEISVT